MSKISPSIWADIYHSPMYESIAGFFLMTIDQEIFKLARVLMIENPLFLMHIGNVWP